MTEPMDALMEGLSKMGQDELYDALIATTKALNESYMRLQGIEKRLMQTGEGEDQNDYLCSMSGRDAVR